MSRDTHADVVRAAQRLVDLIVDAPTAVAFDEHGNGPLNAIVDDSFMGRGPIQRAAEALRQRLLDLETVKRASL